MLIITLFLSRIDRLNFLNLFHYHYIIFTKAAFVSGVKRIQKIFSTTKGVWFGRKIKSNGKSFLWTVKYEGLKCKIDYTSILPSNHFRKKKRTEPRERVRESRPPSERERGRSPKLEIDSTAILVVPLTADQAKLNSTADLPCFSLPSSATYVTNLPFFSLPMLSKPPQAERPTMT